MTEPLKPRMAAVTLFGLVGFSIYQAAGVNGQFTLDDLRKAQIPPDSFQCIFSGQVCQKNSHTCSPKSRTCENVFQSNEYIYKACCSALLNNDRSREGLIEVCKYRLGSDTWRNICEVQKGNDILCLKIAFAVVCSLLTCEICSGFLRQNLLILWNWCKQIFIKRRSASRTDQQTRQPVRNLVIPPAQTTASPPKTRDSESSDSNVIYNMQNRQYGSEVKDTLEDVCIQNTDADVAIHDGKADPSDTREATKEDVEVPKESDGLLKLRQQSEQ